MATSLRESYELLGLPTDASEEEVRKAYKQKARECHPDKNPGDPKATEKFQALRQGYERIVSGSSAAGEFDDDGEQFFSGGFESFFHFVMFHEMMRRRMEEEMMARMFGGIFFDEDSDDDDSFPFGFFGMPFFQRRPRHYESTARSQRWRFHEDSRYERSSYEPRARGPSAKPRKKEKRNPSKPTNTERSGNGNRPNTTEAPNKNNSKHESNFGQKNFNSEREAHSAERDKPNRVPKPKQKSKNKGQMTSSEWQKGRKHKHSYKKKQNTKFTSPSASKNKTSEATGPDFDSESETGDTGRQFPSRTHGDKTQGTQYAPEEANQDDEAQKTAEWSPGDKSGQQNTEGDLFGDQGDKNDHK